MLEKVLPLWPTILSGVLLLWLLLILKKHYQLRQQYRLITSAMPTEYGLPLVGIFYKFLNLNMFFKYLSDRFVHHKSDTVCLWVRNTPIIVSIDPELLKRVTSAPEFLDKARQLYTHFHNPLADGIIVSPAAKWKIDRKAFSRFIGHNNLLSFIPLFNNLAQQICSQFNDLVGCGEQSVYIILKTYGLRLSIQTVMGISVNTNDESYKRLLECFILMLDFMCEYLTYSSLSMGFLAYTPKYNKAISYIGNYIQRLIKSKLKQKEDPDVFETQSEHFIETVLRCVRQGTLSTDDAIKECFTMIAASYETSALATYSTLFLLAMHPEMQERLFEQLKALLPQKDMPVTYEHLKEVPYLDKVLAETLRLLPPIPVVGRETVSNIELKPGLILPKGTQVILPIISIHRSKDIWGSNADEFDPEHFAPEAIAKRHSCAYMPFSKGPRNCIGFRYADISNRIVLITLLRKYKFSTSVKLQDLILRPRVSLAFAVEPRLLIEHRD